MATAGDVIQLLRAQLNDQIEPYRYSDELLRQWLDDGQRLIVQLKPEANPKTVAFVPELGRARQRLNPDDAFALIRVEANGSGVAGTGGGGGSGTGPVPSLEDGWTLTSEMTGSSATQTLNYPAGRATPGYSGAAKAATIIVAHHTRLEGYPFPTDVLMTYGGLPLTTVIWDRMTFVTDERTQTVAIGVLLWEDGEPANDTISVQFVGSASMRTVIQARTFVGVNNVQLNVGSLTYDEFDEAAHWFGAFDVIPGSTRLILSTKDFEDEIPG